jgi:pyridoxal phosphate enzyme (YggS family)
MTIEHNIKKLNSEILETCIKNNIKSEDINIVAVSKTKPIQLMMQAFECGYIDFGENYIQEAFLKFNEAKENYLKSSAEKEFFEKSKWHFIGSLQTNKVKYITSFCSLFHGLDRKTLADALENRLTYEDKFLDCLIQINTSDEVAKSGVSVKDAFDLFDYVASKKRIKIKGLMTIAENSDDNTQIRKNFNDLRELFEKVKANNYPNFEMKFLSMGMSSDFKIALEEGANMLRIGSSIFGNR